LNIALVSALLRHPPRRRPALALVLTFDTVVSLLRVYSVELRDLTAGLDHYRWEIGTVRARPIPVRITYLIGVPMEKCRPITESGSVAVCRSDIPV
jgi:hypothetical protein